MKNLAAEVAINLDPQPSYILYMTYTYTSDMVKIDLPEGITRSGIEAVIDNYCLHNKPEGQFFGLNTYIGTECTNIEVIERNDFFNDYGFHDLFQFTD